MKIVITNVYCYKNKGDAGIVVAMIQKLKETFDNPEITIVSLYPDEDFGKYDSKVKVVPPIIKNNTSRNRSILLIKRILIFLIKIVKYNFGIFNGETEKIIKNADLIISCGGGYMQSHGVKKLFTDYIHHYIQLLCSLKSKNKYIIFAQTIGPFDKISKKITKKIINDANLVLVREKFSYQYVRENFNTNKLYLTSDAAFLLKSIPIDFKKEDNMIYLGLTSREWIYPGFSNTSKKNEEYVQAIVDFIDKATLKYKMFVYIMPQCIGPNSDNDIIISRKIYNRVNNKENCFLLTDDLSPEQLKFLYGQMDYFIGTRMHSNIFALSECVPCIAISYDYKTDGIMNLFDMDEFVLKIQDINSDKLLFKLDKLIKEQNIIKSKINKNLLKVITESNRNYSMIKDEYYK